MPIRCGPFFASSKTGAASAPAKGAAGRRAAQWLLLFPHLFLCAMRYAPLPLLSAAGSFLSNAMEQQGVRTGR